MSKLDTLNRLLNDIEGRKATLDKYRRHWAGEAPAAFMATKSRVALDDRLSKLGVNFPRLAVLSLVDRLSLTGFRRVGSDDADLVLWDLFRQAGLIPGSELVHTDRLLYGSAYVTVWTARNDDTRPVATLDNPYSMTTDTDPATGEVLRSCRTWQYGGNSHAVVFEPQKVTRWRAAGRDVPAGSGAWETIRIIDNPLGVVPTVPFVRRQSIHDRHGTSAVEDVLDLTDATSKVLADAMVTSEYFARPRRWATGLEIEEDDDGQPIDPFGDGRLMQSEDPETKFGQLAATGLDGYSDLLATLTQSVGALTGLPPHYLGLHGDQPANAESVRAAEAQLSSKAYSEQRAMDQQWATVADLLHAVANGVDLAGDVIPRWQSPEIRTPAQAADAAAKLAGIGVPLAHLLTETLGYEPSVASRVVAGRRTEQVERAGLDLTRLLP